ncbi:thyrotropin-releasing hormone receptor [Elysia marginata]|uniref:Thyrotropin-releasing hormone receptor n=1 Tax=Elysia marginata TaxID=1093978 RepID=A0AAV4JM19_9GAST|nr:thyrotropin-releasing hormone receptor [Elysia marginata]
MEEDYANETDLQCGYLKSSTGCSLPNNVDLRHIEKICTATLLQGYVLFSVALILGLPGSGLVLLTLARMPLRPSILYIRLLAVSDFVSLVFAGISYYNMLDADYVMTDSDHYSKWFGRIFQVLSHWLLVLICIERYVSVRFPFQKASLFTIRRSYQTCFIALSIGSVHFILFCVGDIERILKGDLRYFIVLFYLSVYIFLPMTLIVVFTALTASELKRNRGRRNSMMAPEHRSLATKLEADITRMMFLTAIFFIIFTLPMFLFHLYDRIDTYWIHNEYCPLGAAILYHVFYVCASVSFLNHAANFYIYLFGSPGFRRRFALSFHRLCRENTSEESMSVSQIPIRFLRYARTSSLNG